MLRSRSDRVCSASPTEVQAFKRDGVLGRLHEALAERESEAGIRAAAEHLIEACEEELAYIEESRTKSVPRHPNAQRVRHWLTMFAYLMAQDRGGDPRPSMRAWSVRALRLLAWRG